MRKHSGVETIMENHLILSLIFLFHAVCNFIWLSRNRLSPIWDEARFSLMALKYKDFLSHISAFNLGSFVQIGGYYPPLFPISSLILCTVFGNSIKTMAMTNIIYMLIMLFSLFKIGEVVFDRKTGLLAAFIFSMFPIVFGTSRMFLLDYGLTSMVTLSIYILLKTDYFRNTRYSIFFGISLGLGMLTKNTFCLFIIGPLAYISANMIFSDYKKKGNKQIINLPLSLIIGGIISIPWYIISIPFSRWKLIPLTNIFLSRLGFNRNFLAFLMSDFSYRSPDILKINLLYLYLRYSCMLMIIVLLSLFFLHPSKIYKINFFASKYKKILVSGFLILILLYFFHTGALSNFVWYIIMLKDQIGLLFFLFFFIFLREFYTQGAKDKYIIILWVIAPLFLISIFVHKDSRYTMPYLPAIAIILSSGIFRIKKTLQLSIILCLICIFCIIQFLFFSFALYYDTGNIYFKNHFNRYIIAHNPANYWIIHPPIKGEWPIEDVLKYIKNDSKEEKVCIGLFVNCAYLNIDTLAYYSYRNKLSFDIVDYVTKKDYSEYVRTNYLITLKYPKLEQWPWVVYRVNKLNKQLKQFSNKYVIVREFDLPSYWDIGTKNKIIIYAERKIN